MSDETRTDAPAEHPAQPAPDAAPAPSPRPIPVTGTAPYAAPVAPELATPPAAAPPYTPPAPAQTPSYAAAAPAPAYTPYTPTAPSAAPKPASPGVSGATVALAVAAALVMGSIAGVAGGFLGGKMAGGGSSFGVSGPQKITVVPQTTDEPVVAASAAAVPSVVNIDVSSEQATGGESGLPNSHPSVPMSGNGSGVAFKKVDGGGTYILTNNHVVENATKITVADASGKTYKGTLVGRDPDSDIAVVRIAEDLPVIDVGDSKALQVGQTVVAIGSPFGFEHSVTSGVVSALGRSLSNVGDGSGSGTGYPLADIIQTDAAINPGNSGGALVDKGGKLVGINTAIYSDTGQNGGIGFAIPVGTAARVADELIAGGKVGHPFIGLIGSTVTAESAAAKKLSVEQGALVEDLTKGAAAEKAGVKVGDVVTAVDQADIRSMDDLILAVRRHAIGETVKLTLHRGDQTLTLDVVVGDKPDNLGQPSTEATATPGK